MNFRQWLELTWSGEAEREQPELLATAVPTKKIADEPPTPAPTPTARYLPKLRKRQLPRH